MDRIYHGGADPANGGIWFEEPAPRHYATPSQITCYEESDGIHRPHDSLWSYLVALAYSIRNFFVLAS